jgi:Tfp pilus assembly protein PilF
VSRTARRLCLAALLALGRAPALPAQQPDRKPPPPIDTLEARVRADSNDAVVHYELAMGYWSAKRWDDADRTLHQAVSLAPQYSEAYLALSALTFARGEKYWK